jgi:hypothetical protein
MGDRIGIFREAEVEHLSRADRKKLRELALKQISTEVRALISRDPTLFTKIPKANKILRKKLTPTLKRLSKD